MAMTASTSIDVAKYRDAAGNRSRLNRKMPYGPAFSSSAARTIEPYVGASVCASGSHVCNGKTGTFTAKPTKNATNSHRCVIAASESCSICRMSKLP